MSPTLASQCHCRVGWAVTAAFVFVESYSLAPCQSQPSKKCLLRKRYTHHSLQSAKHTSRGISGPVGHSNWGEGTGAGTGLTLSSTSV